MKKYVVAFLSSLLLLNYFKPILRSLVEPYCLANSKEPWFCDPALFWSAVSGVTLILWFFLIVCPVMFLYNIFAKQKPAD